MLGWTYIDAAPTWYQVSFVGIITASFGLRWLISSTDAVKGMLKGGKK